MEVYIDDMVVKLERAEDHLVNLKEVFAILRQFNMRLNPEKCAFGVSSGKFFGFMVSKRGIKINPDQIKAIENIIDELNSKKDVQSLTDRIAALSRFISRSSERCHKFFTEKLFLYLAVSEVSSSAVLVREDEGLKLALEYGPESIKVNCDSQLVVNWVNETFSIKEPQMQKYQTHISDLLARFKDWRLEKVPRESNVVADGLAKLASTADPAEPESRSVIHLLHPIGCEIEVRATGSAYDWRNEILDYLQQGTLPADKKEARKLQVKAARYCLVYGELYRRTFGAPLAKCLGPTDTEPVMQQVHSRYCGNHSDGRSLARCRINKQNDTQRLKRQLGNAKESWPDVFPEVLWSYRVTHKTSTGETPFSLVYGAEALVPIEVMEPSIRYAHATDAENMEAMKDGLDLLEEHRELALIKLTTQKQQVERYYNNKAKLRQIKIRDLVMRMITPATKIPNEGKLGANWKGLYRVIANAGKRNISIRNFGWEDCLQQLQHKQLKALPFLTFSCIR
ncbi:uncharacterized protein LOC132034850 [Lycium ferocissimum]|uniref:uncharacterized protein LOC132034850 n=1 Tax=Lycium ferocissimum TaxID=112874 RepID=UPI0028154446|nr:uncharacterized protein LOC132034850 [Lycium ferocissimum]